MGRPPSSSVVTEQYIEHLTNAIANAHRITCLYSNEQIAEIMKKPHDYAAILCYQSRNHGQLWLDCAKKLTKIGEQIIEFAKLVPGFMKLSIDDHVLLLRASIFEISILRMSRYLDPVTGFVMYEDRMIPAHGFNTGDASELKLINNAFEMAKSIAELKLTESELALYSASILLSPDCPGLQNVLDVQNLNRVILKALEYKLDLTHKLPHKEDVRAFDILMAKLSDLRDLSSLHKELLAKFWSQHPFFEFPLLHKELFFGENT